jgi:hypothetical protein
MRKDWVVGLYKKWIHYSFFFGIFGFL